MALLITNQTYVDQDIVDTKIAAGDFEVQVSPEFELDGAAYRVVLDGHHSLAAAIQAGAEPELNELSRVQHDAVSVLDSAGGLALLELMATSDDWRDALTGKLVF